MADRPSAPGGEILLYPTGDGRTRLEVRFEDQNVWLSQKQLTELYGKVKGTISEHLKHIFEDGELVETSVVRHFRTTAADGKSYAVAHYNLDVALALGFRVRDIRASERRMYLRVREIFALAADYQPTLPETTRFFQVIQNKLHFAVTGKTAAELIAKRADAKTPNMGRSTWQAGAVRKSDVTVAKNYLRGGEIGELNRIVTMWLAFAEDQATRKKQVFLKDWDLKLDGFLRFNDRSVLKNAGRVSKREADARAAEEYERFAADRRASLEAKGEEENLRALEASLTQLTATAAKARKRKP